MPINPHQARLENELVALRTQRVNLRRTLDLMARGHRFGGDDYDQVTRRRQLEMMFKGTQKRWEEVHFLLGRNLPGPAIPVPPAPARSTPTKRAGAVYLNDGPTVRR